MSGTTGCGSLKWSSQQLGIKPGSHVTADTAGGNKYRFDRYDIVKGVQSASYDLTFNTTPVFQFCQTAIYELLEGIPTVTLNISKVLDGHLPIYLSATRDATTPTLFGRSACNPSAGIALFPCTVDYASDANPEAIVVFPNIQVNSVSYTFNADGSAFQEDVGFSANDILWWKRSSTNNPQTSGGGTFEPPCSSIECNDLVSTFDADYTSIEFAGYCGTVNTGVVTDIQFTAPSTITSTTTDLSVFVPGDSVVVSGSVSNNGTFTVATAAQNTLVLVQTSIVNAAAGASVKLSLPSLNQDCASPDPKVQDTGDFIFLPQGQLGTNAPAEGSDAEKVLAFIKKPGDFNVSTGIGTNITFTAPSTISSTGTDLSIFSNGDIIYVSGSTSNDGAYTVTGTPTTTSLTVVETTLNTQAALAGTAVAHPAAAMLAAGLVDKNLQFASQFSTVLPREVLLANSENDQQRRAACLGLNVDGNNGVSSTYIEGPATVVQSITVSTDLNREDIPALGVKGPRFRTITPPISVTTAIAVTSERGAQVSALANGVYSCAGNVGHTACGNVGSNLLNNTIRIATCGGLYLYMGTGNKLQSVSTGGGSTSGDNLTVTYTYQTFNTLTVIHSEEARVNAVNSDFSDQEGNVNSTAVSGGATPWLVDSGEVDADGNEIYVPNKTFLAEPINSVPSSLLPVTLKFAGFSSTPNTNPVDLVKSAKTKQKPAEVKLEE